MTPAPPSDPAPPSTEGPPLPSPLDILEAKRREGQRQFFVTWTGEGGWQVRCLGPVVRRGDNVDTKG